MVKDSKAANEKAKVFSFVPTGEYYFHKGINAYDRFDLNKAKKYLKRALELEPLEPMIACQLALVLTESGEYEESNRLLLMVTGELDERMTECHFFIANNYAYLGLFSEAYKHATLYMEKDEIGEFAEDAQELLEVIGISEKEELESLEEQEGMIDMQERAKAMLESGNFTNAVELLEETIIEFPEFWPAYNNLSLAYFYEGDTGKAAGVLEKVLDRNPGNLHALCNLAIFYYYEKEAEKLEELISALDKVQPILFEHRYKLGATFALTENYDKAYAWLRQIQRAGYEEDEGFYYWLAKSAYHTGHRAAAQNAWKRLSALNPEKADSAPWSESAGADRGSEEDLTIMKLLRSEKLEERLYSLFLISVSDRIQELLTHDQFKSIDDFSLTEKLYLAKVIQSDNQKKLDPDGLIEAAHETALILHGRHKDQPAVARLMIIKWFHAFIEACRAGEKLINAKALAGAVEYLWLSMAGDTRTKTEISRQFGISPATLRKYILMLEGYMI